MNDISVQRTYQPFHRPFAPVGFFTFPRSAPPQPSPFYNASPPAQLLTPPPTPSPRPVAVPDAADVEMPDAEPLPDAEPFWNRADNSLVKLDMVCCLSCGQYRALTEPGRAKIQRCDSRECQWLVNEDVVPVWLLLKDAVAMLGREVESGGGGVQVDDPMDIDEVVM